MHTKKINPLHPIAFSDEIVKELFPYAYEIYKDLLPPLPKEKIIMEKAKFTADTWRVYEYKNIHFKLGPSVHLPGVSSAMIFDYLYDADVKGKSVLIMGVGAGVEPVIAANNNANEVYALDINKKSVEATILNYNLLVGREQTRFYPFVSDLFKALPTSTKVDLITFNSPHTYVPLSDNDEINTNLSLGATISTRFFSEINEKKILKKDGEIIFHLSNTSQMKIIMSYALQEGFVPELLGTVSRINDLDNITRYLFRFTYYDKK